jgi:spore maturation protein CgeB
MYGQNLFLESCWPTVLFQVYVNSFLALLNARHYTQDNIDTNNSYPFHNRHGVYRPKLHIRASEDEELHVSRKDVFTHPSDEAVHPSRHIKVSASSCVIEILMTRFSHSSRLQWQRRWILSRLCNGWHACGIVYPHSFWKEEYSPNSSYIIPVSVS